MPHNGSSSLTISTLSQPMLMHLSTIPRDTAPGTPIPSPSTCFLSIPFIASLTDTDLAISINIFLPLSETSVLMLQLSTISPLPVKSPILIDVPPRSTPMPYLIHSSINLFLLIYCSSSSGGASSSPPSSLLVATDPWVVTSPINCVTPRKSLCSKPLWIVFMNLFHISPG